MAGDVIERVYVEVVLKLNTASLKSMNSMINKGLGKSINHTLVNTFGNSGRFGNWGAAAASAFTGNFRYALMALFSGVGSGIGANFGKDIFNGILKQSMPKFDKIKENLKRAFSTDGLKFDLKRFFEKGSTARFNFKELFRGIKENFQRSEGTFSSSIKNIGKEFGNIRKELGKEFFESMISTRGNLIDITKLFNFNKLGAKGRLGRLTQLFEKIGFVGNKVFGSILSSFMKFFTTARGKLLILFGIIGVLGARAWGNLVEEINKTDMLFRKFAGKAENFVDRIKSSYGLADKDARATINDIQNALAPFFGRKQATTMTLETVIDEKGAGLGSLAQRALDIASLRNLEVADVTRLMTSALVRGGRAAQSLGASMSQAEVNAKAMEKFGVKSEKSLTVRQKIWARAALLMERTADAEGDMFRTATSINNAWRGLVGTLKNMGAGIGKIFDVFDIGGILYGFRQVAQIIELLIVKPLAGLAQLLKNNLVKPILDILNLGLASVIWAIRKVYNLLAKFPKWFKKVLGFEDTEKDGTVLGRAFIEQYKMIKKERDRLLKSGKDNATVALYEAQLRFLETMANVFGNEIDLKDPFEKVNEELEKTRQITASIANNILSILNNAQKLATKIIADPTNKEEEAKKITKKFKPTTSGQVRLDIPGFGEKTYLSSGNQLSNFIHKLTRQTTSGLGGKTYLSSGNQLSNFMHKLFRPMQRDFETVMEEIKYIEDFWADVFGFKDKTNRPINTSDQAGFTRTDSDNLQTLVQLTREKQLFA